MKKALRNILPYTLNMFAFFKFIFNYKPALPRKRFAIARTKERF
jgi:hypothetical protein